MEADLLVGWGWVPKTFLPIPIPKFSDTCSSKISPLHKGAIYIVPRPNLGSDFIFHLPPDPFQAKVYFSRKPLVWGACAHSGDYTRVEKFDSNVFHLII